MSDPIRSTDPARPARRLTRAAGGPISGVSGGLAAYAGVDPTLVRVAVLVAALLTLPLGPIVYAVAWAIIPKN